MATAAEILEKIGESHLECSICFNRFAQPKALDCLHSFCLDCLKHHRDSQDPYARKIKCPLCRRDTTLPSSRLEDLPTNHALSALVEDVGKREQLLQGEGSEITCQSCDEQNQALSFCNECKHFQCQECHGAHALLPVTKSHKMYMLAEPQSRWTAHKSKLREDPKCEKHPDQNINIYCNTCEKLICTTCSVLKHEKHSCADISEAFDKCKQEIAAAMAKVEKKKTQLKNAMKNTAKSRKKLDTMFEATNKKISQQADKEVARIREMEQKQKQEAKEIYQDRVKAFESSDNINDRQLREARQIMDEICLIMSREYKTEILYHKQKFLHALSKLTCAEQPRMVPKKLHFTNFQEHGETARTHGRPILKEERGLVEPNLKEDSKWKLETNMELCGKHAITSVAVFSNNEIITADYGYKQLVTYSPTSNTQFPFTPKILQIADITDPCQVEVNGLDQLIVLDGPAVKTFSREYQLLHQFQPGIDSESKPTCLAVDEDNLIAVGYKAKGEISLHNPDGTLIRRLPAPMIEDHLAISKKRIIYTNRVRGKLVCTDYHGNTVFKTDTQKPKSVCGDSQGNIYVTKGLPSFPGAADIHVFSNGGKHIECAIKQCMFTVDMAITPAGNLVVGRLGVLQTYRRV